MLMKKIFTTFLLICFSILLFAQEWENPFWDVFQLDSLNVWIVGENGAIINTKDAGNSWNDYSIDTSIFLGSVCFNTMQTGYVIGGYNFIVKTTNEGLIWESMELDTNSYLSHVFFVDANHGWISADTDGLYKTIDGGNSWSHTDDSIRKVMFFDPLNGWGEKNHYTLARTHDGGISWIGITTLGYPASGGGSFHFADISKGFISRAIGAGIYNFKTIDGGLTWLAVDRPCVTHGIDFDPNLNGWDAAQSGIHYSANLFETYDYYQLPIDTYLYDISVSGFSNGWAVGGDYDWENGCIWKLIGVNEWEEVLPAGTNDNQISNFHIKIYPNPVKDFLQIEIDLPNDDNLTLSLFDNNGQIIKTWSHKEQIFENQLINISLVGIIPGIYFIQIKSNDKILIQKIVKH